MQFNFLLASSDTDGSRTSGKGGTRRAREREPIRGSLGAVPPAGSKSRAPGQMDMGLAPEAESILAFICLMGSENLCIRRGLQCRGWDHVTILVKIDPLHNISNI